MNFKAALFDLDGTLLDTLDDLAGSMNTVLKKFGFSAHHVDKYKYFVGDGMDILVKRALPESIRNQEHIARCLVEMKAEYSIRWADKTRPYGGIPELLDAMETKGVRLSVLSNKPDSLTKIAVSVMLSKWRFDIVSGVKDGVPKKPDPYAALSIAKELGIPPDDFIYIGDTGTDMQTAVAAGMFPAGALWGFRTGEELINSGARILIRNPADLVRFIE